MVFKNFGKNRFFAAALALMLLFSFMLGSCGKKTFDDPADYFKHVEGAPIEDGIDTITSLYDVSLAFDGKLNKIGAEATADIELSEEALNMIELLAGVDVSWLSNIGIDTGVYMDGEVYGVDIGLLLGESKLLSLDVICDYVSGMIYLSVPEVLTKALAINYNDAADTDLSATVIDPSMLPEGKTLNALAKKYINMVLDGIENVERTEGKIAANGIEQNCSILTVTVTEEDAKAIAKTVLESARADEELKAVIIAFGNVIAETSDSAEGSGESYYKDFTAGIDELLADISEETGDTEDTGDDIILIDYVNSDDEVIGRTFKNGEEEVFSYAIAKDGKNFGFELGIEGEDLLIGSGTADKTVNGTFTVTESGIDYANITLTDFAADCTKGTVDIEILEVPEGENTEMLASIFAVYTIRISFENSADKSWYEFAVMNGEDKFAALTVNSASKDTEKPAVPAEGESLDILAMEDESELLALLDLEPLFENMKNSPIPGEYVNLIQLYLAMALQGQ